MWIRVYPTKKQTLILKVVKRDVFPMKPKLQYHFSQWGKCVSGAKSCKEGRLLCESLFVQFKKWILILKMVERKSFSYETKASVPFIPMKKLCLWCPIMKKKTLLCESVFLLIGKRTLILKMVVRKAFLTKPKDQGH